MDEFSTAEEQNEISKLFSYYEEWQKSRFASEQEKQYDAGAEELLRENLISKVIAVKQLYLEPARRPRFFWNPKRKNIILNMAKINVVLKTIRAKPKKKKKKPPPKKVKVEKKPKKKPLPEDFTNVSKLLPKVDLREYTTRVFRWSRERESQIIDQWESATYRDQQNRNEQELNLRPIIRLDLKQPVQLPLTFEWRKLPVGKTSMDEDSDELPRGPGERHAVPGTAAQSRLNSRLSQRHAEVAMSMKRNRVKKVSTASAASVEKKIPTVMITSDAEDSPRVELPKISNDENLPPLSERKHKMGTSNKKLASEKKDSAMTRDQFNEEVKKNILETLEDRETRFRKVSHESMVEPAAARKVSHGEPGEQVAPSKKTSVASMKRTSNLNSAEKKEAYEQHLEELLRYAEEKQLEEERRAEERRRFLTRGCQFEPLKKPNKKGKKKSVTLVRFDESTVLTDRSSESPPSSPPPPNSSIDIHHAFKVYNPENSHSAEELEEWRRRRLEELFIDIRRLHQPLPQITRTRAPSRSARY